MKLLGVSLSLCLVLTVGQTDPITSTVSMNTGNAAVYGPINAQAPPSPIEHIPINTGGQCTKACSNIPGLSCSKCDRKGNFLPQQCSGSTGSCWCVNIKTGQKIPGTQTPPGKKPVNCESPCFKQKQSCTNLIGSFCPTCDNKGNFIPRQCSGSTGFCWCVNVKTGQKIPGTEAQPWVKQVNCGSPCFKKQQNCNNLLGSFCPQCDGSGNFLPQQCSGSTGFCWCANVKTGQKIPGTETPPGTAPVNCGGPCIMQKQKCTKVPGSFCPKCDSSGNFLPQQCSGSTGSCWCVFITTGQKIPGTETRPGTGPRTTPATTPATPSVNCVILQDIGT